MPQTAVGATPVLAVVAIVAFFGVSAIVVWAAAQAGTLGFDFLAYHQAAERVLDGSPLYDPTIDETGGFGLFYYPPPFALLVAPLGWLPAGPATWLWIALSVAALLGAIAAMPVQREVRWTILLLAGLSWPVAYAFKLGQVGPILLLLFAIGWRWMDRPERLGVASALGGLIKIQPGLVLGWAVLTGRWRAAGVGAVVALAAAVAASIVLGGLGVWTDYLALLRNVSDPITTPHNFTPGAVAYQSGAPEVFAAVIQVVSSLLVVAAALFSAFRMSATVSYLVAVVASQLLSPVLWDHYALLLLLPVAYLLGRGQWWAMAIPLATSVIVLPLGLPAVVYPMCFWITIVGLLLVGRAERSAT